MEEGELTGGERDRRLSLQRKKDGNTEITEGRTQRSQRRGRTGLKTRHYREFRLDGKAG